MPGLFPFFGALVVSATQTTQLQTPPTQTSTGASVYQPAPQQQTLHTNPTNSTPHTNCNRNCKQRRTAR